MSASKSKKLRQLIANGAVMMPGVPNASMARQVERAGFDAVYVSGAGMANSTAGVPDIGLLWRDEVARLASYVAHAVRIPAIVDADTEFGKGPLLTFKELSDFGYRMIIFPQSAFRISMKATEKFFAALKEAGTQNDWLDQMQTRQELYKLLDYNPAEDQWKGFRD